MLGPSIDVEIPLIQVSLSVAMTDLTETFACRETLAT